MKILNATQIRECDAYTIKAGGMGSAELMERAASRCVAWLRENLPKDSLFVVLCGSGNNGGDGLAITRMLHQRGFGVKAFLLQLTPELSPDCRFNLTRLQQIDPGLVSIAAQGTFITDIQKHIVIIDAILGTGLNRPVTGWLSSFIGSLNILQNRKIAIDIPSGLSADQLPGPDNVIVKATDTLSFQFYKRSFLHAEAAGFTGNVHLLDIGLNAAFIAETATQYYITDQRAATALYRPRPEFSHKGTFGSALLIGGQYGKIGAVTLSSKAALRVGAGLVTALVPACGYQILQTAVPESMCATSGDTHIESITGWESADAIGIGPGMGTEPATVSALSLFLETYKKPLVLDADALNIIAAHPELMAKLPKGSVLTPHPKEFARLFGTNTNSLVQVDNARIQAMRYNINIVLKGRHTAVINSDGDCSYNSTGNSGMATGGSGDVLTGVITGLLAQGYAPYDAAVLGVYLHGLAGDIAAAELSKDALIAGDIIKYLGQAFLSLQQQ